MLRLCLFLTILLNSNCCGEEYEFKCEDLTAWRTICAIKTDPQNIDKAVNWWVDGCNIVLRKNNTIQCKHALDEYFLCLKLFSQCTNLKICEDKSIIVNQQCPN